MIDLRLQERITAYAIVSVIASYLSYSSFALVSKFGYAMVLMVIASYPFVVGILSRSAMMLGGCLTLIILASLFSVHEVVSVKYFAIEAVYALSIISLGSIYSFLNIYQFLRFYELLANFHVVTTIASIVITQVNGEPTFCAVDRSVFMGYATADCGLLFNPNYLAMTSFLIWGFRFWLRSLIFSDQSVLDIKGALLLSTILFTGSDAGLVAILLVFAFRVLGFLVLLISGLSILVFLYASVEVKDMERFVSEAIPVRTEVWKFLLDVTEGPYFTDDNIREVLNTSGRSAGVQSTPLLYYLKFGWPGLSFFAGCLAFIALKAIKSADTKGRLPRDMTLALMGALVVNSLFRNHSIGGVGIISASMIMILGLCHAERHRIFIKATTNERRPVIL